MRLEGFRGRWTNPLGAVVPFPYSPDCQNVRTRAGVITKRYGKAKLGAGCLGVGGAANANPITGLYEYLKPSTGVAYQLACSSTFMHKRNGTAWDIVSSTLTGGGQWQFLTSKDLAIGVDGVNNPQKYDGTTLSALGGSPPVASHIAYLAPRVILSNSRSTYWWANQDDPETWGVLNYGYVGLDDGDNITCLFALPKEQSLLVCKRRRIYQMTGTNPLYYQVILRYPSTGVVGPWAIHTTSGGRTFCLSHEDHAIYELGDTAMNRTKAIRPDMDGLNWTNAVIGKAAMTSRDNYLICSVPYGASTVNNYRVVIDLDTGDCYLDPNTADACYAYMTPDNVQKVYAGNSGSSAQVYEIDTTSNDDGTAIDAHYTTGFIDSEEFSELAGGQAWIGLIGTTSAHDLDFSYSWNGAAFSTAQIVSQQTTTASERVLRQVGLGDGGSSLRLKFANNDLGEGFAVTQARLRLGTRGLR